MTPAEVGTSIAVVGCLLGISAWIDGRRRASLQDGKNLQILTQVQVDLKAAHEKIRLLEEKSHDADGDVREIKSDVKHLLESLMRIEDKLDKHITREVKS